MACPGNDYWGFLIGARKVGCDPTDVEEQDPTYATILPTEFAPSQNYPNPFNPATEIGFSLPQPGIVRLDILDVVGQRVGGSAEDLLDAGLHTVTWDASIAASGVYFYRLESSGLNQTRKMVLLK